MKLRQNECIYTLATYIYGGAATGEVNPLKWNAQNLMGIGSAFGTYYATGATNSYIDNYNNKPALGQVLLVQEVVMILLFNIIIIVLKMILQMFMPILKVQDLVMEILLQLVLF